MAQAKRLLYILVIACCVAVVAFALAVRPQIKEVRAERKCGKSHVFNLADPPAFLQDTLALSKAQEALEIQGFDLNRWQPLPYAQSKAPDGTKDRFLCRNVADDNKGVVTFTNHMGDTRQIQVRLSNSTVECVVRHRRRPLP